MAPSYNLLLADVFTKLLKNPSILRQELSLLNPEQHPIIIDEVQKLPVLLDEVHSLIEERGFRFILTGSSARKLKRGSANMLAGRAIPHYLFPLTTCEIPGFDLLKIINYGSLPAIYNSPFPEEDLRAYVDTYIREEVLAEGLVRNLEPFAKFLDIAGIMNAELINFTKISSDLGVSAKTVREYFQILDDTLLGKLCLPFSKTEKRKSVAKAKFYYFDIGVANILANRCNVVAGNELFGKCFEHLIYLEINAFLSYRKDRRALTFWRTTNGIEVDFIIGDSVAIEVKGSANLSRSDLKGLVALGEDVPLQHKLLVCLIDKPRALEHGVVALPYREFLEKLWSGHY